MLIHGAGGQGKEVLECAIDSYEKICFMANEKHDMSVLEYPVLYEQETTENYILENFDEVIVAIGNNSLRLNKINHYLEIGIKVATIIHPKALVSRFAKIEAGCMISENAIIGPFVTLGKGCRIAPNGIVCHECNLDDGVNLSPKATMGGACNIGEKTWLCIGSTLSDHVNIGSNCVIAAGAVVLNDMPNNALIVGMPAFVKKYYQKTL
ncbi:MAG: NeuD/PglB/VioB family sugar acetyltransferase [Treponema sp.]|nr:NeuD/PglB/VioB family sugar acetyltransferase [Treponema sp.]